MLTSLKERLFPHLTLDFVIRDINSDYVKRLTAPQCLVDIEHVVENESFTFEIAKTAFAQGWLWVPIVGQATIKDGAAHFRLRFVGFDHFFHLMVGFLLLAAPLFLITGSYLSCLISLSLAFFVPRAVFYRSVVPRLGLQLKRFLRDLEAQ